MMMIHPRHLLPGALILLSALAQAETFVLKDGSKIEGRIIEETPTQYLLEIRVSASIKDRRTIAKADVTSVIKPDPAEEAYQALRKQLPMPDNASAEHYDALLDSQVLPFLKNFPKSPKVAEVKKLRDELSAERNQIAAGGVRIGGTVYAAADREANAYDLDALLAAAEIRLRAQRGELTSALRLFDAFERDFAASSHYRETAQFATRILNSYREAIQQDLNGYDNRVAARQLGLQRIPIEERRRSEELIEAENKAYLAQLDKEKASNTLWPTLHPYHPEPMRATLQTIATQLGRLQAIKFDELPDGGKAFRDAWRAAAHPSTEADLKVAIATMQTAKIPARYLERVTARANSNQPENAPDTTPQPPGQPGEKSNENPSAAPAPQPAANTTEQPAATPAPPAPPAPR